MESVRKVRQKVLEFYEDNLVLIQYLIDYDDLQETENEIFVARSSYDNCLRVKLLNRNKVVNAMEKQVEMIKSYLQSNGHLPGRSKMLQQFQAEKSQIAIKEYEILLWKLEN